MELRHHAKAEMMYFIQLRALSSISLPAGYVFPCDIDLSSSGAIVASSSGKMYLTDTSFSSITSFTLGQQDVFVSFVTPEPSTLMVLIPLALLGMKRRARRSAPAMVQLWQ
jgi:hypothetical protein